GQCELRADGASGVVAGAARHADAQDRPGRGDGSAEPADRRGRLERRSGDRDPHRRSLCAGHARRVDSGLRETAMTMTYEIVDVFTDAAFGGNPLAVVFGGEGLGSGAMQAIARE